MGTDAASDGHRAIDLGREPEFTLADMTVTPATLQAAQPSSTRRLEPKIMQTLVALARRRGEVVPADELWAAGWGGRVVGQDALYRCLMAVRKLGQQSGAFTVENVRGVGYRLAETGSTRARSRKRTRATLAACAVLLIGLAAWGAWQLSVGTAPRQNGRVEVADLEPLDSDPEVKRLSVAIGDSLAGTLANSGVETGQAKLGADRRASEFTITGAIDRQGGKAAANVRIVDRASGTVMWSGRFDRDLDDTTGFPEEVANRTGDALYCALGSRSRSRKPMSAKVFALFLSACADRRPPNGGSERFFQVTRQLTQSAPDLSVAYSMHAVAAGVMSSASPAEAAAPYLAANRAAANRALALDPRNGEAYFAVGLSYRPGGQWIERERNFAHALALTPNLSVVRNYEPSVMREVGRREEANRLTVENGARDVYSSAIPRLIALDRIMAGDRPGADKAMQHLDLLSPAMGREARFQTALWWTDPGQGLIALEPLASGIVSDGDLACARAHLEQLTRTKVRPLLKLPRDCGGASLEWRVRMLARQGDIDGAYAALAAWKGGVFDTSFLFYPELAPFRADAVRFMPLARRLGLIDYWQQTGHWPDFCQPSVRPYDCQVASQR